MRINDPLTEGDEPFNLVPLTDMVFNLLIFFMCATTFVQVEKDMGVQLPKTTSSFTPLSALPKQLIINIEKDGTTVIAGKTFDAAGLAGAVKSAVQRNPEQTVIIRADERSIMKYFAGVARTCRSAGVREARIVYLDEAGKAAP